MGRTLVQHCILISHASFYPCVRLFVLSYKAEYQQIKRGYYNDYKRIMLDKLQRLGIPFIVFTILAMLVKVLFPGDVSRQTSFSIQELFMAIINPFDGPNNEMWFIGTLLWLFAFTPLWRWACQRKETEWLLLAALALLHFYHPNKNLLCIRQICTEAIFFYSGILICKYSLEGMCQKLRWYLMIGGLVGFVLCYMFSVRFVVIWSGIACSAGLAFILDEYLPKAFCGFRNYTYQIFLMGIFVQIAVKIVYKHVHAPYIVGYMVCLFLGLYVPVVISKIIERLNWKSLLLCVGLKKNI